MAKLPRPSLRLALLFALAALGPSGCGFVITNGPPANHATMPYFSCTESKAGPILDVVLGRAQPGGRRDRGGQSGRLPGRDPHHCRRHRLGVAGLARYA